MRKYLLCYQLLFSIFCVAQDYSTEQLHKLEDEGLLDYFNVVASDSVKAEKVARIYLERGRARKDTIMMARGYDRLARIFHPEKNLQLADSIIMLTEHLDNVTYPALGYMIKGVMFGQQKNIYNEIYAYLKCYEIAVEKQNYVQQAWILNVLIMNKIHWGNKQDALKLQYGLHRLVHSDEYRENLRVVTRKNSNLDLDQLLLVEHIKSLNTFAKCFKNLKQYDSALYYVKKQKNLIKKYQWIYKESYELSAYKTEISVYYNLQDYSAALKLTDSVLMAYTKELEANDIFDLYKIKGLSKLNLSGGVEGFEYLNMADSLDKLNSFEYTPQDRELFEKLFLKAKKDGRGEIQIKYLNKLIKMDSGFISNYRFFDPHMLKRFDIPKLIREKEHVIKEIQSKHQKKTVMAWTATGLFSLSLCALMFYISRERVYARRYAALMAEYSTNNTLNSERKGSGNGLPSELITTILTKLDAFEEDTGFLASDLTLNKLAKKLDTNANYLSRIINVKREKNFSSYLNDLRINYALRELKTNNTFRKYSVKAIAKECGYKSGESFSRAFYKEVGIYPSYYIKKLEKDSGNKDEDLLPE